MARHRAVAIALIVIGFVAPGTIPRQASAQAGDPGGYLNLRWGMTPDQVKAVWQGSPLTWYDYSAAASDHNGWAEGKFSLSGHAATVYLEFGCASQLNWARVTADIPGIEIFALLQGKYGNPTNFNVSKYYYDNDVDYYWQFPTTIIRKTPYYSPESVVHYTPRSRPDTQSLDRQACAQAAARNANGL